LATNHLGYEEAEQDETLHQINAGVLGETSEPILLDSKKDFHNATMALAHQARAKVCIFSHDLDGDIYDNLKLLGSLKRLATESPDIAVYILLQNSQRVQTERHRLLELAGRLPSKIKIFRPTTKEYLEHMENFMLIDDTGFIFRKWHTRFEGRIEYNNRLRARELAGFFQDAWKESEEDVALRRLGI